MIREVMKYTHVSQKIHLFLLGEFPVLKSGEDVLITSSKIMDYLREKVGIRL